LKNSKNSKKKNWRNPSWDNYALSPIDWIIVKRLKNKEIYGYKLKKIKADSDFARAKAINRENDKKIKVKI
jgi:hypothetical protein